ncbi:transglutaminase family protein [Shouchella sp. 1P09AA]|uniref:transglutaminase family protein n=1 Tax=unclassified Shouchella TaxID=2893065 RepID=UPI0039A0D96D
MKAEIVHTNRFYYDTSVEQSLNSFRLKPKTDELQRLLSYRVDINPNSTTAQSVDIWGNNVETFFIAESHQYLEIKTTSVVSVQRSPIINHLDYTPESKKIFHSEVFRRQYLASSKQTPYTNLSFEQTEEIVQKVGDPLNPITFSRDLMAYLYEVFTYDTEASNVQTLASESADTLRGVCQDYAHVMIGVLRSQRIPARYVSGYLYVGEDSALIGDAASHAWVEVMIPGIGWVGLDPTNNVEALENHIIVCTGRDYGDVSPVEGVYRGGGHSLDVSVGVHLLEK